MHSLLTRLAFAFGLAGTLGAIAIVAGQWLSWIELGNWPELSLLHRVTALGWRVPATWFGKRVINTVLDFPLSVVFLVLGLALRQLFVMLAAKFRLEERQTT